MSESIEIVTRQNEERERQALRRRKLAEAERALRRTRKLYERTREERNHLIAQALADGWTHQQIADATGLSRGRVSQIRLPTEERS